jgi:hypothetical protein
MKLYSAILPTLLFLCTLSSAVPVRSRCGPSDVVRDALLRNRNGASIGLLSNELRMNVVQSHIDPTSWHPLGGFMISIINDYCLSVEITFRFSDGTIYRQYIHSRSIMNNVVIPHATTEGRMVQVTVQEFL